VLEETGAAAGRRSGEAVGRSAAAEAAVAAARRRLDAAASEARVADGLDPEAPCPLCGQELGASFDEVQRHRDTARREAEVAVGGADAELAAARAARAAAEETEQTATTALRRARRRHERWATLRAEVAAARAALDEAEGLVAAVPGAGVDAEALQRRVAEGEAARDAALRLEERLKAQPALAAAVAAEEATVVEAGEEAAELMVKGKALHFDAAAQAAASSAGAEAAQAVGRARAALTDARLDERGLSERLAERRTRLDAEMARRAELAGRESEARHLGRLAELLGEFTTASSVRSARHCRRRPPRCSAS
jgi:exonuclease SbcC